MQLPCLGDRSAGAHELEPIADQKDVAQIDRGEAIRVAKLAPPLVATAFSVPVADLDSVPVVDRADGELLVGHAEVGVDPAQAPEHAFLRSGSQRRGVGEVEAAEGGLLSLSDRESGQGLVIDHQLQLGLAGPRAQIAQRLPAAGTENQVPFPQGQHSQEVRGQLLSQAGAVGFTGPEPV